MTLAQLSEAEVLAAIFPRLPESTHTQLGPGDDAAVLAAPDGRYVVTTDMMIEGPDFRREWSSAHDLGWKAAATNLADVAAMGAAPTALVVSVAVPADTVLAEMVALADGLREACAELAPGCGVVGGDLSTSAIFTISVTAFGDLEGRAPVTRSGAHVGDVLAVAGSLGDAGLGLDLLFADLMTDVAFAPLITAQLAPAPPISLGAQAAHAGATSGMDVSDGLVLDASRLASASGVVVDLDSAAINRICERMPARELLDADQIRNAVLYSGESHALLFTFGPTTELPSGFTQIGQIAAGEPGAVCLDGVPLEIRGWNPYRANQ